LILRGHSPRKINFSKHFQTASWGPIKMPRYLLGLTLLFWGWQTGGWLFAIIAALLLEGARLLPWRWEISETAFRQAFKAYGVFFALVLVYLLLVNRSFAFIYTLLQWSAVFCFPLVMVQTYSTCDRLNLRAIFAKSLPSTAQGEPTGYDALNLQYPYWVLCLLSASAANTAGIGFYFGMVVLIPALLWKLRPQQGKTMRWLCLMVLAAGLGFGGQIGLHQLHVHLEQQALPWLTGFESQSEDSQSEDLLKRNTRMGDIGSLKQSNAIIFRVARDKGPTNNQALAGAKPLLLRETIFNKYGAATWIATQVKIQPVFPEPNGTTWTLGPTNPPSESITVSASLERGEGVLKLPTGTSQIQQLPVTLMERNLYGTIKVLSDGPRPVGDHRDAITYRATFNPEQSFDAPPGPDDLRIPVAEKAALQQTLKQLDLTGQSPQVILERLPIFFEQQFQYSLKLTGKGQGQTPLSTFLLQTRTGHCEYFATASTLLLREMGIPARYVTGYSVHQFSPWEGQYIVRSRDAHAWTLAYVDGIWRTLDPTPPDWTAQENGSASPFQMLTDAWSLLQFKLATELRQLAPQSIVRIALWAMAPLGGFLLWRLRRAKFKRRSLNPINPGTLNRPIFKAGLDSEFYLIEKILSQSGLQRLPAEALSQWMDRLQKALSNEQFATLQTIVDLHYRYRFDPQEIDPSMREQLRRLSQAWLAEYQAHRSTSAG
jgi:protein-glutamine gamma-glutamyltransferase